MFLLYNDTTNTENVTPHNMDPGQITIQYTFELFLKQDKIWLLKSKQYIMSILYNKLMFLKLETPLFGDNFNKGS